MRIIICEFENRICWTSHTSLSHTSNLTQVYNLIRRVNKSKILSLTLKYPTGDPAIGMTVRLSQNAWISSEQKSTVFEKVHCFSTKVHCFSKSPLFINKSPLFINKSPLFFKKSTVYQQKSTVFQKVHCFSKSPLFFNKSPLFFTRFPRHTTIHTFHTFPPITLLFRLFFTHRPQDSKKTLIGGSSLVHSRVLCVACMKKDNVSTDHASFQVVIYSLAPGFKENVHRWELAGTLARTVCCMHEKR